MQEKAVEGLRRFHGKNHTTTLKGLTDLAYMYNALPRLSEAIEILNQYTFERSKLVFGEQHPNTLLRKEMLLRWIGNPFAVAYFHANRWCDRGRVVRKSPSVET